MQIELLRYIFSLVKNYLVIKSIGKNISLFCKETSLFSVVYSLMQSLLFYLAYCVVKSCLALIDVESAFS